MSRNGVQEILSLFEDHTCGQTACVFQHSAEALLRFLLVERKDDEIHQPF